LGTIEKYLENAYTNRGAFDETLVSDEHIILLSMAHAAEEGGEILQYHAQKQKSERRFRYLAAFVSHTHNIQQPILQSSNFAYSSSASALLTISA
jgi:hypothetical protein